MAAAYKNSPKWVKRMEELFDQSDLNKNGTLSIEDFYIWIEQLEKEVKPEKALLTKLRQKCKAFWENVGLVGRNVCSIPCLFSENRKH